MRSKTLPLSNIFLFSTSRFPPLGPLPPPKKKNIERTSDKKKKKKNARDREEAKTSPHCENFFLSFFFSRRGKGGYGRGKAREKTDVARPVYVCVVFDAILAHQPPRIVSLIPPNRFFRLNKLFAPSKAADFFPNT